MESAGAVLFLSIMGTAAQFVYKLFTSLGTTFGTFERSFVTLYIVIVGYQVMKGAFAEKTKEWLMSIIYLAVFQVIVVETTGYIEWVIEPILGTVFDVVSWLAVHAQSGGNATGQLGIATLFSAFDQTIGNVLNAITNMKPAGSYNLWLYIQASVVILALTVIYAANYAAFFVLALIGVLSMDMLFVFGPVFLFFMVFKETRFIAISWLRAIANYAMMVVFVGLAASLMIYSLSTMSAQLVTLDAADGVMNATVGGTLLVGVMSLYLLLKAPDLAAAVTGGSAGNTSIVAGGLALAAGSLASGTQKAWGSEGAKAARQWAGQAIRSRGAALASYGLDAAHRVSRAYSRRKGVER